MWKGLARTSWATEKCETRIGVLNRDVFLRHIAFPSLTTTLTDRILEQFGCQVPKLFNIRRWAVKCYLDLLFRNELIHVAK
jgi:hypothetical protein